MSRIGDWWRRLTGGEAGAPPSPRRRPPRMPRPVETAGAGDLELTDSPGPKRPSRTAEAGFDPYASDAGFAKPHSWEHIDHD